MLGCLQEGAIGWRTQVRDGISPSNLAEVIARDRSTAFGPETPLNVLKDLRVRVIAITQSMRVEILHDGAVVHTVCMAA